MKYTIKESALRDIISETVTSYLNEGLSDDNPIRKWVYWCYNYHAPHTWMDIFDDPDHMAKKFMNIYDRYGSDAVMNRFFIELSSSNQARLIDYVMNNYNG